MQVEVVKYFRHIRNGQDYICKVFDRGRGKWQRFNYTYVL